MRINEQWKKLRQELNDMYEGSTLEESECMWGSNTRGPHVTIMIPAKKDITCPCCQSTINNVDVPKPTEDDIIKLMEIVNKYLCSVSWDGNIKHGEWRGHIIGWFYEIIFDKK